MLSSSASKRASKTFLRTLQPSFKKTTRRSLSNNEGKKGKLILVRHGQSIWNVNDRDLDLVSRFTGWTDIELTSRGRSQALAAGSSLTSEKITVAYVSLLKRALSTLEIMASKMNLLSSSQRYKIPVTETWRLNERHYGSLCGMSKLEAEDIFSVEDLSRWRNGWDTAPPKMDAVTLGRWRKATHCKPYTHHIKAHSSHRTTTSDSSSTYSPEFHSFSEPGLLRSKEISKINTGNWQRAMKAEMPASESLKDTVERVRPLWEGGLKCQLLEGENVLVVAHANIIRSLLYHFDPHVNSETLKAVKIPSAQPLICRFENVGGELINIGEVCGRTKLKAEWVESEEIEKYSFCTLVGESALEHEIA
ncbi:hypothetical protein TrST_g5564 [Triparma strigata]|uniref:Phosphoglycerate mutase n=1 Tax=Triparma strigata TaxID=1606541 RepID=A0A9W7EPV2_9STRA|nr:hypothetical protein TrST_g5564 [Triparma strigata]